MILRATLIYNTLLVNTKYQYYAIGFNNTQGNDGGSLRKNSGNDSKVAKIKRLKVRVPVPKRLFGDRKITSLDLGLGKKSLFFC